MKKVNIIIHFLELFSLCSFSLFLYIYIFYTYLFVFCCFLYLEIKLNIISLNHTINQMPQPIKRLIPGDHVPIPRWVTPQIFIHTVTVGVG